MLPKFLIFILRPFAGPIRYLMMKLMKRFRVHDDPRPIIAASEHILHAFILPTLFATFNDTKFRELANFKKLPRSEHDRIFNELEVSGVCISIFYLRSIKTLVRPEDYHFWQDTEWHLPKQLQQILLGYRIDSSNAKLMRELIEMRLKEYEEMLFEVHKINQEMSAEFKSAPTEVKEFAAALQVTAVGTVGHIRRGKYAPGDPLIHYLGEEFMKIQRPLSRFVKKL